MGHRDPHGIVAVGNGPVGQAVALRPEDHGQLLFRHQCRMIDADGVLPQGHRRGLEAVCAEKFHSLLRPVGQLLADPGPGDLKDGSHADPDTAPVQRVGGSRSQQHRVHSHGGGTAEDRPQIGRVHHVLQHDDALRIPQQRLSRGQRRTLHGAEHTAGQREAGQLLEAVLLRHIDRHVAAAGQDLLPALPSVQHLRQHQERLRLAAGIQRTLDDMGTFRDEQGIFNPVVTPQLCLRETGIDVQLRRVKIGDFDESMHVVFLLSVVSPHRSAPGRDVRVISLQLQNGPRDTCLRRIPSQYNPFRRFVNLGHVLLSPDFPSGMLTKFLKRSRALCNRFKHFPLFCQDR